jgi:prephenate dehydrogenase
VSEATRVAINGLGVIGGSAALKLLQRGAIPAGYARDESDRELAAKAGVRVGSSLAESVRDADLILLAVPLDQLAPIAGEVVGAAGAHATILHAAGLQRPDATRFEPAIATRVIGTHPLAGSTESGFAGADAELFHGATVHVEERGTRRMREDAELFWSMAGARRIEYMDAAAHDDLMAAVSHVPQILATSLAATLAYAETPRARLGPGGRDMTRLAASSWDMWRPLLTATPGRTLALLESIESELRSVREAVQAAQLEEPGLTWSIARSWALDQQGADPRP